MKKVLIVLGMALYLVGLGHSVFASASSDEAKAMVEKAATYFQANGKEKALKEFNNPQGQFVKGELYVFAWDMSGTNIAHPINPKQVGVNVLDVPDVDGKYFRKEGMELVKKDGTAWVDYKFKNPKTNKVEQKTTYLKKVGDVVLGCGAYK
jgi:signal transduction histidine kinase